MIVNDLRNWIQRAEEIGELEIVEGADWNLEIGALTLINSAKRGKALLFDRISGYRKGFRVLTGSLGNSRRVALTFNLEAVELSDLELTFKLRTLLKRVQGSDNRFEPKQVTYGPVLENVKMGEDINLLEFPSPKWHELDGGRYIGTGDAVITRDPDSGSVNIGVYRVMVHDRNRLGIWLGRRAHARTHAKKYFDRGESCPIAISVGHDPLLTAVGGSEIPFNQSEFNLAGALRGAPYDVVRGRVTGLPIPAHSEIVIEGYMTTEKRSEGPFGENFGYYAGGVMQNPVIDVEAVYHRNDPIILGAPPSKPPHDYSYFRCPWKAALVWDSLEREGVLGIRGVWFHEAGIAKKLLVISLKQQHLTHAKQAAYLAGACESGSTARWIIVVDEDIDPTNTFDVLWALSTRADPIRAIDIIPSVVLSSVLDPVVPSEKDHEAIARDGSTTSRAILFACKPYERMESFPLVVDVSKPLMEQVSQKFKAVLNPSG